MNVRLRAIVAMAFVTDVPKSIEFYRKLGFEVANSFTPDGMSEPTWAWLETDRAQFMISKATEPVIASQQAVMFYIYCDDVIGKRAELENLGVNVGPLQYPFYSPQGEFRVSDPDGYVLMITHVDE